MPDPCCALEFRWSHLLRLWVVLLAATAMDLNAFAQAAPAQLTIDINKIVTPISPMLYGLMTEEINHSYDGGLYGELIQNRTFRSTWEGEPPWDLVRRGNAVATRSVDRSTGPSKALSYSMKLSVATASAEDEAGLTNPGYWGYRLRPNTVYNGSLYARVESADIGPITVKLVNDATGAVQAQAQAQAQVSVKPGSWKQYVYKLRTAVAVSGATWKHTVPALTIEVVDVSLQGASTGK